MLKTYKVGPNQCIMADGRTIDKPGSIVELDTNDPRVKIWLEDGNITEEGIYLGEPAAARVDATYAEDKPEATRKKPGPKPKV